MEDPVAIIDMYKLKRGADVRRKLYRKVRVNERKLAGFLPAKSRVRKLDRRSASMKDLFCYQCSICSNDEYVQNGLCSGIFYIRGTNLMSGQRSCRCKRLNGTVRKIARCRLTEKQRIYQVKKRCEENGFTFISLDNQSEQGGKVSRKVKVICFCGKEFEVSIHGLMTGNRRSCGCFGKRGFDPTKEGHVYLVEWRNKRRVFIKVGITSSTVKRRIAAQSSVTDYTPEILYSRCFKVGQDAFDCERQILSELAKYRSYATSDEFPDGYTETFSIDFLETILSKIKNFKES